MGKLATLDLKKLLHCVKNDQRVVVPPQVGFDSGVHVTNDNDRYLVVSTDPCVDVPEAWFGWLLIHYVASDIALFGAKMEFCALNLLGKPSTQVEVFQNIMKQACDAADKLGAAIVTGHTGTYDGLSSPIGVCTGYGYIDKNRLITPAGAKPNDQIFCVKPIGLETVVNFALTHEKLAYKLFGVHRTEKLRELVPLQSCVKEAVLLSGIEGVYAMHDATEGGVVDALNEMAKVSNVGFRVEWENFPITEEVHKLRENYRLSDLQMLSMSSTGTILAAVSPEAIDQVDAGLRRIGVEVRHLGSFTKQKRRILMKNAKETNFPKSSNDPYAMIFSSK